MPHNPGVMNPKPTLCACEMQIRLTYSRRNDFNKQFSCLERAESEVLQFPPAGTVRAVGD